MPTYVTTTLCHCLPIVVLTWPSLITYEWCSFSLWKQNNVILKFLQNTGSHDCFSKEVILKISFSIRNVQSSIFHIILLLWLTYWARLGAWPFEQSQVWQALRRVWKHHRHLETVVGQKEPVLSEPSDRVRMIFTCNITAKVQFFRSLCIRWPDARHQGPNNEESKATCLPASCASGAETDRQLWLRKNTGR